MPHVFPLAPMSPLFRWLTVMLWVMPPVFIALGLTIAPPAMAMAGLGMVALYAAVWLGWRPSRFELEPRALHVVFPTWRRTIPATGLRGRPFTVAEFKEEFGFPIRIGVGGLWGGFGWLWTTRRGMVEFYVSRAEGMLLLERPSGRPLLITPERPESLLDALGSRRS